MRSLKKGPYIHPNILRNLSSRRVRVIKTMDRASILTNRAVGRFFVLYNGYRWIPLRVTRHMVGHKLGEFVVTKKLGPTIHHTKKNIKKKRKLR